MKKAVHLLLFKRHRKPGAKGWELRKALGSDYLKILKILDSHLKTLDLTVKTVFEEEKPAGKATPKQLSHARFYITLKGGLESKETKLLGWRIDDLAGLAASIAFIMSKRGKAPRKDVEDLLGAKLPGWKIRSNIDRYIRYGYLAEDENQQLYLDWRTETEIDQEALMNLFLSR